MAESSPTEAAEHPNDVVETPQSLEDGPSPSKRPRLEEENQASSTVDTPAEGEAKETPEARDPGSKRPRLEEESQASSTVDTPAEGEAKETPEARDPGKKQYRQINKCLKQIKALVSKPEEERDEEVVTRLRELVKQWEGFCMSAVRDDEVPNQMKFVQMHLKHVIFNSEKVRDGDNIKNFLSGLEDGSASTSDKDSAVYVFLANFATELWYCWNDGAGQWQWTPEKWTEERKWWLWMLCSTTVVTDGQWKNETPAPENVEIIKYLDAVRPVPSDEQYLPQTFDIADLFKKLLALSDDQVTASVKAILEEISGQEVQSKNDHVVEFLQEVDALLKEDTNQSE